MLKWLAVEKLALLIRLGKAGRWGPFVAGMGDSWHIGIRRPYIAQMPILEALWPV